jgi:hypothetical protein
MCCAGERHFAHVDDAFRAGSRSAAQTGPSGTFAARVRVCFTHARVDPRIRQGDDQQGRGHAREVRRPNTSFGGPALRPWLQ